MQYIIYNITINKKYVEWIVIYVLFIVNILSHMSEVTPIMMS